MVDIPGNTSTTRTISIGGTTNNTLEFGGDHDWFRIALTAGQSISVSLQGLSLADPIVTIRNASGAVIYQNDDWGDGLDAFVAFQAPATGTYYIDVGSAPNNQTGTYQLSVAPYTPPPVAGIDAIAHQLTDGFWNGDTHHFDVSVTRAITVNLTGIDAQGLVVARAALALWTDITGIAFPEVLTGGQIVFGQADEGTGAFSNSEWANGIISASTVNVAPSRLSMHTYLHEIAHALGLGHAGDYNGGTAYSRYPYEAMFLDDGAAVSIMSYFDNGESSYYSGLGFTNNEVLTPQLADILAMGNLYGLSTTTRPGDTIYGFNNSSGRDVYNAANGQTSAYTVFDAGGTDTLDYSGFGQNQLINLNAESFSNVGAGVGNVSIARGVLIENAIGGSGGDTLIGNSVANLLSGRAGADVLTGGPGFDTFQDAAENLNGDTITDLAIGDRIVITDASLAGFSFSLSGNTLTFSGGSLTFGAGLAGHLVATAAADGGVQLTLQDEPESVRNDFNGDGRSDILWRSDGGQLSDWLGQANGGFANNDANAFTSVSTDWYIVATGDFNGDRRADIVWRNDDGGFSNWLGQANGGFVSNDAYAFANVSVNQWGVAGTGDFNGDGRDDILWRSISGQLSNWLGTANGGFTNNDANAFANVPTDWVVAGTGDFNNDGHDDILWRNFDGQLSDWLGQANGGFVNNDANALTTVSTHWHVFGTGDFNGDGYDDILWRSDMNGDVSNWLGQADGGFVANDANAYTNAPMDWNVYAVGDYNGDGFDDILWMNGSGQLSNWLGSASGAFVNNDANAFHQIAGGWHVEPPLGFI